MAVESTVGEGTCFSFRMAVEVLDSAHESLGTFDQVQICGLQANQQTWRILVADDDRDNRLLLEQLLRQAGFAVEAVENGARAVERFQVWQPHFIWLDMRMPVMDGYTAATKIRTLFGGKDVKIVAVTANVFQEDRAKILAAGCDDLVSKPFRTPEVFQVMEKYLGVRYEYTQGTAQSSTPPPRTLRAEHLQRLPQALLNELHQAALRLDMEHIAEITVRIRAQDAGLADSIEALTKKFDYKRVCKLCEQATGGIRHE